MAEVIVKPVTTPAEQKAFLDLPWALYQADPNWVPPLRRNQKELVGFKNHPFYQIAESQAFLAEVDGEPCGRILAIVNHAHNERFSEKRGFFGFFESADDPRVAQGLFQAACRWLSERGMTSVRGPANPSLNYECGLLVDGFDSSPTFMMTYNPPFYSQFIEAYGFQKVQDMYSYYGHVNMLDELDPKLQFIIEEAKRRFQITLRPMDRRRFNREVRLFLEIYNRSLVGTWGFVPLSEEEVDHLANSLRYLIEPALTCIAEVERKPVAAVFGLLDYNPRIKRINGRLLPLGFLRLLWNKRKLTRVRVLATNVLPEYQKWGIGLVVLSELVPAAVAWGVQEAEFSWVLESNHLSRASLERGGAQLDKTYRMYDLDIS